MFFTHLDISKLSRAQQEFLSKFVNGKMKADFRADAWDAVLKDGLEKTFDLYIKSELIREGSLSEKIDYSYKVTDLKKFLKENGEKVTGTKSELVARAIAYPNSHFIQSVQFKQIYFLSDLGASIVEKYLQFKQDERRAAEEKTYEFLKARDFTSAVRTLAEFEANQVFYRGIGIDWKNYDARRDVASLKFIFGPLPRCLQGLPSGVAIFYQLAGAMKLLWGGGGWEKLIPEGTNSNSQYDDSTIISLLFSWGLEASNLQNIRASSEIFVVVEIMGMEDSCDECKRIQKFYYPLDNVPQLPYEKCTDALGCRCSYRGVPRRDLGKLPLYKGGKI